LVPRAQLDVRFHQPVANQLESLFIAPVRVVKSRCVDKNDAGSVSFMVQNTRSLDIFGDEPEPFFSPLPPLAGERIDNLYYKLVETVRGFNLQG